MTTGPGVGGVESLGGPSRRPHPRILFSQGVFSRPPFRHWRGVRLKRGWGGQTRVEHGRRIPKSAISTETR